MSHDTTEPRRVLLTDDPLPNPHRFNTEVHYRLYLLPDGTPTVLCVQDFDYHDYDAQRFLTTDAYEDEAAANAALAAHVAGLQQYAGHSDGHQGHWLVGSGIPVSRDVACLAHLYATRFASGLPAPEAHFTPREIAYQLRTHAYEQDDRTVTRHLMQMADRLDGGRGPSVHHGCPDPSIPTADCHECHLVIDVEVEGRGRPRTLFAEPATDD